MSVDPFTFEVIRHKLMRVVDEAVITLKHISGSSTTTEGHDLIAALYRADGSLLMGVVGFLHALPGAGEACRHILREYAENPGIFDGDVFLLNDPYIAALHSSDTYVISPIFYDGQLVAWSANFIHVRDIGAINPGGFAPESREIFHEGIMCPGIKVMERGVLRKDVWKTLLNMVRTPEVVALDLYSQIAANITAKERMLELIQRYGLNAVNEVGRGLIEESETLLRKRLRELPNGTWRARQYLDTREQVHTVNLAMTKRDDSLLFDFTGTSEQAPVGFNSTYWGTLGALVAPLFPLLAYDMLWNDGLLRPIRMIAPEGSLVNAKRPAPNCLATITGIVMVNNVSLEAISKMLAASDRYRKEATAVWQGARSHMTICGHRGSRYVVGILGQEFGGSGGARTFKDGVDYGGCVVNPVTRTPNIESEELNLPILYLFRRLLKDSGGPGRFRGGMTVEYAITAHGARDGQVDAVLYGTGTEFTQCQGLSGGYPGSNCSYTLIRGSDVWRLLRSGGLPEKVEEIPGSREPAVWGIYRLQAGDMLHKWVMGGGGYGDPLERDPALVSRDVLEGLVSPESARRIYGVALGDGSSVDEEETSRLRREMISSRLNGGEKPLGSSRRPRGSIPEDHREARLREGPGKEVCYSLSEPLRAVKASNGIVIQCRKCGHTLSSERQQWKDSAALLRASLACSGPWRTESRRFEMRQYLCPRCGRLLDVEVALPGDPPLHDEVEIPL
ncbi:MAG: hydantoinase B/oxoprolinase family protein [Candidatus Tectomicrobia bacterium]|nr:hydantoinase B/oxoprolinase family protein [Candidatus Tectomicrobia bacterium]